MILGILYSLTNHLDFLIHKADVQDFCPESYLAVFYLWIFIDRIYFEQKDFAI